MIFNYGILFDFSKLKWNLQEYVFFFKNWFIYFYMLINGLLTIDGHHWPPYYGGTMECGPLTVLLNVFFCVQQNKEIHTGLEKLEDE